MAFLFSPYFPSPLSFPYLELIDDTGNPLHLFLFILEVTLVGETMVRSKTLPLSNSVYHILTLD